MSRVGFVKRLAAAVSDAQVTENPLETLRRLCEKMRGTFEEMKNRPGWYLCFPESIDYEDIWDVVLKKEGGRARLTIDSVNSGLFTLEARDVQIKVHTGFKPSGRVYADTSGVVEVHTGTFTPVFRAKLEGGKLFLEF